jgi:hypothetical protein
MIDEFERSWMETLEAQSRYYSGICPEGLRETTEKPVRIAGVPNEI